MYSLGIELRSRAIIKAGVLGAEQVRFQVERQRPEEFQHLAEFFLAALVAFDRLRVYRHLVEGMFAQVTARDAVNDVRTSRSIQVPKAKRIEFMISHQGNRIPGIAHGPHQVHHIARLVPAVDVVSEKHHGTRTSRIAEAPLRFHITELREQQTQLLVMPVDIADKVYGWEHERNINEISQKNV